MPRGQAPGGLFSKVVNMVRPSADPWADLDQPGDSAPLTKQQLKAMVERKRHNDLLRKREFDLLRKLRRRDPSAEQEVAGHPSLFNSVLPAQGPAQLPQETLQQIADIEADMSMDWWQTGKRQSSPGALAPIRVQPKAGGTPSGTGKPNPDLAAHPGAAGASSGTAVRATGTATLGAVAAPADADPPVHNDRDPALEQAAALFAQGKEAEAEATLLDAIAPLGDRHDHIDTWLVLFDYYRATGQAASFESLALEFAQHFARSAPAWFSMPEGVPPPQVWPASDPATRPLDWSCPETLSCFAAMALAASTPRVPGQWRVDWSMLTRIDGGAVEPLLMLLRTWRDEPLQLQFIQPERLQRVLAQATPIGDPTVRIAWWHLRLEVCRLMGQVEAFDQVALDYCVTYERSPPSWEPARCAYTPVDTLGFPQLDLSPPDSQVVDTALLGPSAYRQSEWHSMATPLSGATVVDAPLSGVLVGDAPAALAHLSALCAGSDALRLDCSHLVRVDVAAAGALLNWVVAQRAERRTVAFTQVHRLLAPLFGVVGIEACAAVEVRTD